MVDLTPAEAGICLLAIVRAEFAAGWEGTPPPEAALEAEGPTARNELLGGNKNERNNTYGQIP